MFVVLLSMTLAFPRVATAGIVRNYNMQTLDDVRTVPLVVDDNGALTATKLQWRARDTSLALWPFRWFIALYPALLTIVFVSPKLGIPDQPAPNFLIWGFFSRMLKVPWVAYERIFLQHWKDDLDAQTVEELRPYRRQIRRLLFAEELEYFAEEVSRWLPVVPINFVLKREAGQEGASLAVSVQYGYPDRDYPEDMSQLTRRLVPVDELHPRKTLLGSCATIVGRVIF